MIPKCFLILNLCTPHLPCSITADKASRKNIQIAWLSDPVVNTNSFPDLSNSFWWIQIYSNHLLFYEAENSSNPHPPILPVTVFPDLTQQGKKKKIQAKDTVNRKQVLRMCTAKKNRNTALLSYRQSSPYYPYKQNFVYNYFIAFNACCVNHKLAPAKSICQGFPGGSEVKASVCNAGDLGSIPGLRRCPGEGEGKPLQCSCLENPMDGGAWWATVHGAAKSQTRLSQLIFLDFFCTLCCWSYWASTPPEGSSEALCAPGNLVGQVSR